METRRISTGRLDSGGYWIPEFRKGSAIPAVLFDVLCAFPCTYPLPLVVRKIQIPPGSRCHRETDTLFGFFGNHGCIYRTIAASPGVHRSIGKYAGDLSVRQWRTSWFQGECTFAGKYMEFIRGRHPCTHDGPLA